MPEIVYNVKFRIKQEQVGKQGVADITRYEETIERLKNTINQQAAAAGTAEKANKQYTMSMKGVTQVQGNANKQVAIGNQLFFSLSDGIQDSAQFSQGFAQGMRAVGNNIGFTAELMGSFIQRTKEMNNGVLSGTAVMAGLRQSFLGVGGIIFAINTAVTLMTVFGDRIFDTNKEAEKLADTIRSLAQSEYKNFVDRSASLNDELMVLEKALAGVRTEEEQMLDELLSNDEQLDLTRGQIKGYSEDQLKAVIATKGLTAAVNDQSRVYGNQFDRIESINAIQGAIAASQNIREKEIRDAVQRTLVDRRAEIEVIQLLRKAYEDLGLTQAEEQDKSAEKTKRDAEAAQKESDRITDEQIKKQRDLLKRSLDAQREIDLLQAKATVDEVSRATAVRDVRLRNLQEIADQEGLVESEIALRKLQIENDYSNEINKIRDNDAKREASRREQEAREAESNRQRQLALDQAAQRTKEQIAQQAVSSFSNLLIRGFNENKGIAIAATLVETLSSAVFAYKKALAVPGVGLGFANIAAGSAVAQGLARVAAMRKVTPKSKGASDVGSSGRQAVQYGFSTMSDRGSDSVPSYLLRSGTLSKAPFVINLEQRVDESGFGIFMKRSEAALEGQTFKLQSQ